MNALVTGANGLIGANLVRVLLHEGLQVRALVRPGSVLTYLNNLPIEFVDADVTENDARLAAAVTGMDFIFHTAMHFAYTGRTAAQLETTAVSGTDHILRAAAKAGVKRAVVTSSSVVFGYSNARGIRDEQSGLAESANQAPYVAAKIKQDHHALQLGEELGMEVVLVCPTMSIGPFGRTLGPSNGMIVAYLNDPWRCTYPGGCNIVSTIDVGYGHWLAAQRGIPGARYILGSENLEWRDIHGLVAELCGVAGPQAELNHTQAYLASTVQEVGAWLGSDAALSTREQAAMVGRFYWYSHERAAGLGYQPRPARAAMAEAISWLAGSPHISRELRTTLRLHPDVYAARRNPASPVISK